MTHKEVAEWMVEQLEREKFLYQEVVVFDIAKKFGKEFVHEKDNGNLGIDPKVLKEFRKLTENVVWEGGDKCWRYRESGDPKGKRKAD